MLDYVSVLAVQVPCSSIPGCHCGRLYHYYAPHGDLWFAVAPVMVTWDGYTVGEECTQDTPSSDFLLTCLPVQLYSPEDLEAAFDDDDE